MSIDSAHLYYALNPQIFCSYDIVYLLYHAAAIATGYIEDI